MSVTSLPQLPYRPGRTAYFLNGGIAIGLIGLVVPAWNYYVPDRLMLVTLAAVIVVMLAVNERCRHIKRRKCQRAKYSADTLETRLTQYPLGHWLDRLELPHLHGQRVYMVDHKPSELIALELSGGTCNLMFRGETASELVVTALLAVFEGPPPCWINFDESKMAA